MHPDNDQIAKDSVAFIHKKTGKNEVPMKAMRELWNAAKMGMVVTGCKKAKGGNLTLTFTFVD